MAKDYSQRVVKRLICNRNTNYFTACAHQMSNEEVQRLYRLLNEFRPRRKRTHDIKNEKIQIMDKLIADRMVARIKEGTQEDKGRSIPPHRSGGSGIQWLSIDELRRLNASLDDPSRL